MKYAGGSLYEGKWKDDKKEGRGTYKYPIASV